MSLWMVAISDSAAGAPEPPPPLAALDVDGLRVYFEPLTGERRATRERLAEHARVVAELHRASRALLPLRFGQTAESRDELRRDLASRAGELRVGLARIAGCSQWTLRLLEPGPAEAPAARPPRSGAEYLRARRRATGWPAEPADLAGLRDRLRALAREEKIERRDGPPWWAAAYHLVDDGSAARYRETGASEIAPAGRDRRWSLSGPWPAWAFGT